jgi:hypothetical protein
MLSKCANPECSETFRYLHQGKIFCLAPTPEVETISQQLPASLEERFWLCDACSKIMTVMWGGTTVKLVPLPVSGRISPVPNHENHRLQRKRPGSRTAYVNREDE